MIPATRKMLLNRALRCADNGGDLLDGVVFEIEQQDRCALLVGQTVQGGIEFLIAE